LSEKTSLLKRLLVGVLAAITLVSLTAVAAPFLLAGGFVKAQVASLVRQKTGRDLRIAGTISFSLLPRPALVAHDVALSSPPGGFTTDLLEIMTVEVSLKLGSLLHGELELDQIRLTAPKINFEIDKEGRRNWIFHRSQPGASATPGASSNTPLVVSGDATIIGGAASYFDQRKGRKQVATGLNLALSLPSPSGPLHAAGAAIWNGEAVRLALSLARSDILWEGGTSAAAVNIASQRAKFDFTGEITGGPAKASGAIDLKMPSLRDFLAWAELKFPAGIDGFGPLTVSGRIAAAGSKLTLDNAAVTLDRIAATGALTAERGARRPTLSGHLDIDRLDLDPYVKAEAPPDATPSPGPAPKTAAPPAPKPSPTPSSWSEATINLAPLKLIDADLSLIANAMSFRQVETGKTVATLRLTDGRLGLDINDVALSGGKGTGRIVADSSGEVPGFGVALRLTGITVGHVAFAFAGFDELSGTGDVAVDVTGHGRNPRDIVASLTGAAGINFTSGTIGSIGLSAVLKNNLGPAVDASSLPREIDYRSLSGTAAVDRGIFHNRDLRIDGPRLSATGTGLLDLPLRRIDYLWLPAIIGLGSARIAITSLWADPAYEVESVTITKRPLRRSAGRNDRPRECLDRRVAHVGLPIRV
jgi:AsmA protein